MTRKSKGSAGADSAFDRVFAVLDEALAGMHDIEPATGDLPSDLPEQLIELYSYCDGARLFLETFEIVAPRDVKRTDGERPMWLFGRFGDDPVFVDAKGRVWRDDESIDAPICEGTSLDRWLSGFIDATAMLYDHDGEFADDAFDEDGELMPIIAEKQLRAQLKRDPKAPAPRWRLAHALLAQDATQLARQQLEELVANEPSFAWGWLELARIAETTGDLEIALDDATAGAEAAKGHDQEGYFWAQVARLASRKPDETARVVAADRASRLAPELRAAQLEGARAQLADGDPQSARGLLDLLRAVWPKDLEVLALARQLEQLEN